MKRYELTALSIGDGSSLPEGARQTGGLSIAIGFFDGVHLGHADVVRRAVAAAREKGQTPAVMTFDPHPRAVLRQGDERFRTVLTPLEDKLALLEAFGVEEAFVIRFDRAFAEITAERFVRELLLPLHVRTAVVGFDFAFGYKGEGKAESLSRFSDGAIEVTVAEPVRDEVGKVSSTRIRERLGDGECAAAAALLGRPYAIRGKVVHGQARGRLLGFPTANLLPEQPYVIPRTGVYAVTAAIVGEQGRLSPAYPAVLNVGYRPTFEAPMGELKLEAHLLDFEDDLYGRELELTFRAFLRDEQKFASIDDLIAQIGKDVGRARLILA